MTSLIVPLALIEACSDDPAAAPSVAAGDAGEAGTIIDRAEAGSGAADGGTADSGPSEAGCSCNDEDDMTLDFCPPSPKCGYLSFYETTPTELRGDPGGGDTNVVQVCPRPSVLVGFSVVVDRYDETQNTALKAVSIICGTPSMTPTLALDVSKQALPFGPVENGQPLLCDGVVRGFGGRGVHRVDQFVGHCARLAVESTNENGLKLSLKETAPALAGVNGDSPFPDTDCPSVAVGLRFVRSASLIEGIGVVCGEPDLWWE